MAEFLLRGLLLVCCFLLAQSLRCNDCQRVSDPAQCHGVKTCGQSEVCFSERVLGDDGRVFYNSGCTKQENCTNGVPCNGHLQCVNYCSTYKCNTKSCMVQGTDPAPVIVNATKRSCKEYKEAGRPSGVYTLDLRDGLPPFQVFCDMDTAGGAWTVFQRRKDGSVSFYLGWEDYKKGFGNLQGEFWSGNDHLHRLTKAGLTTLRVDLGKWQGYTAYAQFSSFQVGPASDYYRLSISGYSGTAGDSLSFHNGMAFSTNDRDYDKDVFRNCAFEYGGGWWYNNCFWANLNGVYNDFFKGIFWKTLFDFVPLISTEMKLREP